MPKIEAFKALEAIKDGYPFHVDHGYVIVQNPSFVEDDGSNPNLVFKIDYEASNVEAQD